MAVLIGDNYCLLLGKKALDSRYLNITVPWTDKSEALNGIRDYRYRGLTINIGGEEYWWKDGTDDADLVKKTNNDFSGYTCASNNSISIGQNTMPYTTTSGGTSNVAIGEGVMATASSGGSCNIAIGYQTLYNNGNAGVHNIGLGYRSLYGNTGGCNNVALGYDSLCHNINGVHNIGIGNSSLKNNSGGSCNISIGYRSLLKNSGGSDNISIGTISLCDNITGGQNISIGCASSYKNVIGGNNVSIGEQALFGNTGGSNNITLGCYSLLQLSDGSDNIAIGRGAGYTTTGSSSVFLGRCAGFSENNSNRLHIGNAYNCSLIYGEFDNKLVCVDNKLSTCGFQMTSGATVGYVLTASDANGNAKWEEMSGGGSGENVTKTILQTNHGFALKDYVGWSGGTYNKAIADGTYDGEFIGIVTEVVDSDTFKVTQSGYVSNTEGFTGFSENITYFLSEVTAGLITASEPTGLGEVYKSVFIADSEASGWVLPYVGSIITSGETSGGDANNATRSERISLLITQPSHGFVKKDVIGFSGGTYNKAIADGTYGGEILGMVVTATTDTFEVVQAGFVSGLTGFTANTTYFLSDEVSGGIIPRKPSTLGSLTKPVIIADSEVSGWVLPYVAYLGISGSTIIGGGGGDGILWDGDTTNAIGTYIDANTICASPSLTYNGSVFAFSSGGSKTIQVNQGDTVGNDIYLRAGAANNFDGSSRYNGGRVYVVAGRGSLEEAGAGDGGVTYICGGAGGDSECCEIGGYGGNVFVCGGAGGAGCIEDGLNGSVYVRGYTVYLESLSTNAITCTVGTHCVTSCLKAAESICTILSSGLGFKASASCGCAVDWIATSDCRVKKNIVPITSALSKIDALCGVCYNMCRDDSADMGLLAQQVLCVEPRLVTHGEVSEEYKKYGIEDDMLGLKYDKFAGLFVEAIKELKTQNECLQIQINELRKKV